MAVRHRKLFLTNSTECQIYPCDPYSYPDPDFFLPLPPPPPPPPSTATSTLSPYLIISLSLFAAISVLLTAYVVLAKHCFRRPRHQPDGQHGFMDHNHGPEIDHPIWYINTVGLQSSVLNSIAIFKYKKGNIPIEGTTCSVCLSEFTEDEMLRLLPSCNHAFHVACIDTWLRSHTNCPLCRARILPNGPSHNTNDENTNLGNNSENVRGVLGISGGNRGEIEDTSGSKEIISDSSVVWLMREKGRRSVSMDSSSICIVSSDFQNDQLQGNLVNNNFGPNAIQYEGNLRIGCSSSAESMNTSPVTMKRSFSCSGRLFSSRYNSKSSILPL